MERVAFLLGIQPGQEAEYKRRHDEIWPEMVSALTQAGARNYSIFFDTDGTRQFAYLETEPDFKTFVERIGADPVNARWQEYMRDIMNVEIDPSINWPVRLEEAFHMD
ncbi:MAG: L-rhamnose mutarotase [Chloroflexota bacterium]